MIGEIEFYKIPKSDYQTTFKPGQFFYAPIPFFYPSSIKTLTLDYFNPSNPDNCNFRIQEISPNEIKSKGVKPIPEINVKPGEILIMNKHKIRPVISISNCHPYLLDSTKSNGNCIFCVPLYSTKDKADNYKFSEEFIKKIQAYQYPTLFLLPEDKAKYANESIVRFSRAGFIPQSYLNPIPLELTEIALECITKWFHFLTLGELDETISIYKQLLEPKLLG